MKGCYTLKDLKSFDEFGDPYYSLEDVLDHNEMIAVMAENERRANEAASKKARKQGASR